MLSIPLTKENILNNTIDKIDTWPYLPSGLLIKPAHKKDYTDQLVKLQHSHFAEMQRLVERYRDKQKISISWILAAGVGISGNFIVNLFFGRPKISNTPYENLFIAIVIFLFMLCLFFKYQPSVEQTFLLILFYKDFPNGIEKYVQGCQNPLSQMILSNKILRHHVEDYASLIRLAILRDYLQNARKKIVYAKISIGDISHMASILRVTVSIKGIKPYLDWHSERKIRSDLRYLLQAFSDIQMICSVRDFEIDPSEWQKKGASFLDETSNWEIEDLQKQILSQIVS